MKVVVLDNKWPRTAKSSLLLKIGVFVQRNSLFLVCAFLFGCTYPDEGTRTDWNSLSLPGEAQELIDDKESDWFPFSKHEQNAIITPPAAFGQELPFEERHKITVLLDSVDSEFKVFSVTWKAI